MKILFIDQSGNLYGSERGLLTLLSQPPLTEFEAVVGCPSGGRLWQELSRLGIPLEAMEFNRYSWRQRPDWQLQFLFHFISLLHNYQPQAVVLNFEGHVPSMVLACRMTGYPVIRMLKREVRSQSSDSQGYKITLGDRLSFLNANGVICISGAVETQLRQALDLPPQFPAITLFDPQEVTVVPQAAIDQRRQQLGVTPDTLLVGLFARIHPIKGIDLLIQAAPRILQQVSNVRFVIVGDPDNQTSGLQYRDQLKNLTHQLEVADYFIWTGFVPDPLVMMATCDIVTLPTRAEGLGRVLIEAWSVGRPVVASQTDGPEEVIGRSGGGLLHPIDDPPALAHQLMQLLSSAELRSQFGQAGYTWVKQNCDPAYYRAQFLTYVTQFITNS